MRILFEQGTPVPLRRHLTHHVVDTACERGWSALHHGELLDVAEQEGYDLLITTDQTLRDQQHLADRQLAIIVLLSTSWPHIQCGSEILGGVKVPCGSRPEAVGRAGVRAKPLAEPV
jgi:hypothetical protein